MNNSMINKIRVKKFIISCANNAHQSTGQTLPDVTIDDEGKQWKWSGAKGARVNGKFTQVSPDLLDEIDGMVRELIDRRVTDKPQHGKMVK